MDFHHLKWCLAGIYAEICQPCHRPFFSSTCKKANDARKKQNLRNKSQADHWMTKLPSLMIGQKVLVQYPISKKWDSKGAIKSIVRQSDITQSMPMVQYTLGTESSWDLTIMMDQIIGKLSREIKFKQTKDKHSNIFLSNFSFGLDLLQNDTGMIRKRTFIKSS